jgi:hypothetical protein
MCGELHNVIACFTMKGDLDSARTRGGEAQGSVEVRTRLGIASVLGNESVVSEQLDAEGGGAEFALGLTRRRFNGVVARAATLGPHVVAEVPTAWQTPNLARDTR